MAHVSPNELDYSPGKLMYHGKDRIYYVGRCRTGAFVFEYHGIGNRIFKPFWPFQLSLEPYEIKSCKPNWVNQIRLTAFDVWFTAKHYYRKVKKKF